MLARPAAIPTCHAFMRRPSAARQQRPSTRMRWPSRVPPARTMKGFRSGGTCLGLRTKASNPSSKRGEAGFGRATNRIAAPFRPRGIVGSKTRANTRPSVTAFAGPALEQAGPLAISAAGAGRGEQEDEAKTRPARTTHHVTTLGSARPVSASISARSRASATIGANTSATGCSSRAGSLS